MIIDVNAEFAKDIDGLEYKTVYMYPQSLNKLPVVSWYELTEDSSDSFDGESHQTGYIQVDIFTQKRSEIGKMTLAVNKHMTSKEWRCEAALDVPDNSEIYHKTMRFKKVFF